MRALYTAASGMIAQQTNVDNIANNLANVNTTGYKTSTVEFKTLLYQTIQAKTTTANGENKPIGAQVGLGTRNSSITTQFTQGPMYASESTFAFGIEGDGLFAVLGTDGNTYYTRNGDFQMAMAAGGDMCLCTSEGYPVLDSDGEPIIFSSEEYNAAGIGLTGDGEFTYIDSDGNISYITKGEANADGEAQTVKIGLYQFTNRAGLINESGTLFRASDASGPAFEEGSLDVEDTATGEVTSPIKKSKVNQGYLEGSNVQVVDEMVSLITAQRAYEMNSKAIQAADDMLGQANQLKR